MVATSEEQVAPNVWKYGIGLSFQIERGFEIFSKDENNPWNLCVYDLRTLQCNLSIDFRPRSSVWKTGMVLSNCQGTIDELYRGEVCAVFYHVMPDMPRYKAGDRIGQIKLGITLPIKFEEVEELDDTERGNRGFGSTGLK